eukprot:CAMPEP_0197029542 /NCGR_PEP_ID=MMETSP1384-20130603/8973_1 /TAXON_ID=29189 /ORGANISM="Ammonia sp." /LENGTH=482 /DNA_ID=CAMNT_0042458737 /DNA_START=24 /DNA_END=1472 /DNA_ORIENTATION=-
MASSAGQKKEEPEEEEEKATDLDELSPLKLSEQRRSEMLKTPRKMSIQNSVNKISSALQEEDGFASSSMMGSTTATHQFRINRRIEQSYLQEIQSMSDPEKPFNLGDILENINSGMQVIVDDDFSLCFKRAERRPWNFNAYLFVLWLLGVIIRYCILFPLRLLAMIFAILSALFQFWLWRKLYPNDPQKLEQWELWSLQLCVRTIIASWGAVIEYKGVPALKKPNQIYVANHSTMVDWLLLMYATPFCVVGQLHPTKPSIYWFQSVLLKSLNCIWFDRSEQKDRSLAMNRIKEHIADVSKPRLLIFPEGTCVNNEYCIQFKKGAFSIGCEICPVAIKYNKSFIDAYWISRERPFHMHLFDIMTSWAMVAEVYYLEPQTIRKGETDIDFANRCKKLIADAAGLKNVDWNGYLKHYKPSERVIDAQKKVEAEHLEKLYQQISKPQTIIDQTVGNGVVFVGNQDKSAQSKGSKKKRKSVDQDGAK